MNIYSSTLKKKLTQFGVSLRVVDWIVLVRELLWWMPPARLVEASFSPLLLPVDVSGCERLSQGTRRSRRVSEGLPGGVRGSWGLASPHRITVVLHRLSQLQGPWLCTYRSAFCKLKVYSWELFLSRPPLRSVLREADFIVVFKLLLKAQDAEWCVLKGRKQHDCLISVNAPGGGGRAGVKQKSKAGRSQFNSSPSANSIQTFDFVVRLCPPPACEEVKKKNTVTLQLPSHHRVSRTFSKHLSPWACVHVCVCECMSVLFLIS